MKKYIISRLSSGGRRQYIKRLLPSNWSDYECDAMTFSESTAKAAQRFLQSINPYCPIEIKEYHPPKLP